jgi:RNA 2',3'-cyclic 3'-phosphodiesterase
MARLFFALVPPPAVSDALDDLCTGLSDVDWSDAADFHLTLAFLGEVSEHHIQDLIDIGRSVRTPSFRLELESVGLFSSRGRPRVLWAGVHKEEKRVLPRELR